MSVPVVVVEDEVEDEVEVQHQPEELLLRFAGLLRSAGPRTSFQTERSHPYCLH